MKFFFTAFTLFLFVICSGQTDSSSENRPFVLTGKLRGRDTRYIVLLYPNTQRIWVRDTSYLENGNFKFEGAVKEPSFAHLIGSDKDGNYSNFFLEAGPQHVELEENNFDHAIMQGSKTQELYDSLQKEINKISARVVELQKQKSALDSASKRKKSSGHAKEQEQIIKALDTKIDSLFEEQINLRVNFIKQHPDSYVSVTELSGLIVNWSYPVKLAKPLYEALNAKVKDSKAGEYCLQEIVNRSRLMAGSYLPAFQTKDVNDKLVALSDFRNKYVLLDFWASWCVPCRKAIPELKEAYAKYHSKGLEIIAISSDRDINQWKKAIQVDRTDGWVQLRKSGEMEAIFKPIPTIPQQILLDPQGKIIWSGLDDNTNTWMEALEDQLTSTPKH